MKSDTSSPNSKFYEILGIHKKSTQDEVRKAYRKLVMKLHPDKGGNEKEFKELQEAYEVLSDPDKRAIYDKYGIEGLQDGYNDEVDPFSGNYSTGGNSKKKCKFRLVDMWVSLEDMYRGGHKAFEYSRRTKCTKCNGTGAGNPAAKHTCGACDGQGVKLVIQRMGNLLLQSKQACDACGGSGSDIKDKCSQCKGTKAGYSKRTINVHVDKGTYDGYRYTFFGDGDEHPGFQSGDLYIEVCQEKHKHFIRKGADLIYKLDITLLEALVGFEKVFTHLNGKVYSFTSQGQIIQPGTIKSLVGMGMPFFNSTSKFGNMHIEFQVLYPESLFEEEAKLLETLFNERLNGVSIIPKNDKEKKEIENDKEIYKLSPFRLEDENTSHYGGKSEDKKISSETYTRETDYDEDFTGYGGGHGYGGARTVNCGHQ